MTDYDGARKVCEKVINGIDEDNEDIRRKVKRSRNYGIATCSLMFVVGVFDFFIGYRDFPMLWSYVYGVAAILAIGVGYIIAKSHRKFSETMDACIAKNLRTQKQARRMLVWIDEREGKA